MLTVPEMLINPAKAAGMKVPEDPNNFSHDAFPHFNVFCNAQLGRRMTSPLEHWHNAVVIAKIEEAKIKTITPKGLKKLGFRGFFD